MRRTALRCLLLLAVGFTACRRRTKVPERAQVAASTPPPVSASASTPKPAPPPRASAWSVATTMKLPPQDVPTGVANVTLHVPEGFDAKAPLHLVILFHGAFSCAAQDVWVGEIVCKEGEAPVPGFQLAQSHDDAGTMSILVAPQHHFRGGGGAGRMYTPGYFTRFVEEIVTSLLVPAIGPHTLDDVASITLMGHSAGWAPIVAVLARGELPDKVRNVVIFDSPFAHGWELYPGWIDKGTPEAPRKLVSIYGPWGDTGGSNATLAKQVRARKGRSLVVDPKTSLAEAIQTHDVVITSSPVDHYWMPHMLLTKVLEGLPLPKRELLPIATPASNPIEIAKGVDVQGALEGSDGRRANNSIFDDYAIHLDAGEKVLVTVTGQKSVNEFCCDLDTEVQILKDGALLARDDDGGGYPASRLVFTAPTAGHYLVRVTTPGSFYRAGPYVLRVSAAQ